MSLEHSLDTGRHAAVARHRQSVADIDVVVGIRIRVESRLVLWWCLPHSIRRAAPVHRRRLGRRTGAGRGCYTPGQPAQILAACGQQIGRNRA